MRVPPCAVWGWRSEGPHCCRFAAGDFLCCSRRGPGRHLLCTARMRVTGIYRDRQFRSRFGQLPATPGLAGGSLQAVCGAACFSTSGCFGPRIDGERVFIDGRSVYKLGIPLQVRVTPIDLVAGWRLTKGRLSTFLGAGMSSVTYKETGDFSEGDDNVSRAEERASGPGGRRRGDHQMGAGRCGDPLSSHQRNARFGRRFGSVRRERAGRHLRGREDVGRQVASPRRQAPVPERRPRVMQVQPERNPPDQVVCDAQHEGRRWPRAASDQPDHPERTQASFP